MSLKTEVKGTVHFFQLLEAMEGIIIQASMNNPEVWRHFCQRDAERLDGLANAVRGILTKTPTNGTMQSCVVCGRLAPLTDGECPDCCH